MVQCWNIRRNTRPKFTNTRCLLKIMFVKPLSAPCEKLIPKVPINVPLYRSEVTETPGQS